MSPALPDDGTLSFCSFEQKNSHATMPPVGCERQAERDRQRETGRERARKTRRERARKTEREIVAVF